MIQKHIKEKHDYSTLVIFALLMIPAWISVLMCLRLIASPKITIIPSWSRSLSVILFIQGALITYRSFLPKSDGLHYFYLAGLPIIITAMLILIYNLEYKNYIHSINCLIKELNTGKRIFAKNSFTYKDRFNISQKYTTTEFENSLRDLKENKIIDYTDDDPIFYKIELLKPISSRWECQSCGAISNQTDVCEYCDTKKPS